MSAKASERDDENARKGEREWPQFRGKVVGLFEYFAGDLNAQSTKA